MTAITVDQADIAKVQAALGDLKDKYKSVMTTSINKTLTTARTQATARIGNELNLKAARIKQDFTVKKANFGDISGSLKATGEPVGLINFGANQTQKGVSVKVLKSSSRSLIKHAYIGSKKGQTKQHVYWREYDGPRNPAMAKKQGYFAQLPRKHFKKWPVLRRTGPRIEDIYAKPEVLDPVTIQAQHVYLQNVDAKIDEILRRHSG